MYGFLLHSHFKMAAILWFFYRSFCIMPWPIFMQFEINELGNEQRQTNVYVRLFTTPVSKWQLFFTHGYFLQFWPNAMVSFNQIWIL